MQTPCLGNKCMAPQLSNTLRCGAQTEALQLKATDTTRERRSCNVITVVKRAVGEACVSNKCAQNAPAVLNCCCTLAVVLPVVGIIIAGRARVGPRASNHAATECMSVTDNGVKIGVRGVTIAYSSRIVLTQAAEQWHQLNLACVDSACGVEGGLGSGQ
jgi:hypothetical protein